MNYTAGACLASAWFRGSTPLWEQMLSVCELLHSGGLSPSDFWLWFSLLWCWRKCAQLRHCWLAHGDFVNLSSSAQSVCLPTPLQRTALSPGICPLQVSYLPDFVRSLGRDFWGFAQKLCAKLTETKCWISSLVITYPANQRLAVQIELLGSALVAWNAAFTCSNSATTGARNVKTFVTQHVLDQWFLEPGFRFYSLHPVCPCAICPQRAVWECSYLLPWNVAQRAKSLLWSIRHFFNPTKLILSPKQSSTYPSNRNCFSIWEPSMARTDTFWSVFSSNCCVVSFCAFNRNHLGWFHPMNSSGKRLTCYATPPMRDRTSLKSWPKLSEMRWFPHLRAQNCVQSLV